MHWYTYAYELKLNMYIYWPHSIGAFILCYFSYWQCLCVICDQWHLHLMLTNYQQYNCCVGFLQFHFNPLKTAWNTSPTCLPCYPSIHCLACFSSMCILGVVFASKLNNFAVTFEEFPTSVPIQTNKCKSLLSDIRSILFGSLCIYWTNSTDCIPMKLLYLWLWDLIAPGKQLQQCLKFCWCVGGSCCQRGILEMACNTRWLLPFITDALHWVKCINPNLPIERSVTF